jgi:hypothetical protein
MQSLNYREELMVEDFILQYLHEQEFYGAEPLTNLIYEKWSEHVERSIWPLALNRTNLDLARCSTSVLTLIVRYDWLTERELIGTGIKIYTIELPEEIISKVNRERNLYRRTFDVV